MQRGSAWIVPTVALAASIGSAAADSLSSLPDPRYARTTPPQPEPIVSRIGPVVYPTLGFPALVPYGGEFDIVVATASEDPPAMLGDVRATLRSRMFSHAFPLSIVAVDRDPKQAVSRFRARVPARAPREIFDLELAIGHAIHSQPNAVRVYGEKRPDFRFAVVADHQVWDPTWKVAAADRSAGDWPRPGESSDNRAVVRQQLSELALLDPEFVVHAGDLLFGLDYGKEYAEAYDLWREARFATFMIPGNHDAYASYGVRLEGTPLRLVTGVLACREHLGPPYTWPRAFAALECVYGDIKGHLFSDLRADGLSYWRRTFGPPYYAWDHGQLHFVALNTYDGSAARRHSFAVWIDAFDLHLGAPAVDNYGGYLGDAQLAWLADDLRRARAAGKTVVVFGHHDPRGNQDVPPDQRYQPNLPFPTHPLGLGPFQEWNYDDPAWSSGEEGREDGIKDGRKETPDNHSGTSLLRLLAEFADYYIDGHAHHDDQRAYQPGDLLAPGVVARRPIEFVRVTTSAGAPRGPSDYWGYRLFEITDGGKLRTVPYEAAHGLASLPSGNFWQEPISPRESRLRNGLPSELRTMVRLRLPVTKTGWDFVGCDLVDMLPDPDGKIGTFYAQATVAASKGGFPATPGHQASHTCTATPRKRSPMARLSMQIAPVDGGKAIRVGQAVGIRVSTSTQTGPGLVSVYLRLPQQPDEIRGTETTFVPKRAGAAEIRVEALDAFGRRSTLRRKFMVAGP